MNLHEYLKRHNTQVQCTPRQPIPLRTETPSPTTLAIHRVIEHVWDKCQGCGPLCEWIVRRECDYHDGPGRTWPPVIWTYAACRDAACWFENKSESALLIMLRDKALWPTAEGATALPADLRTKDRGWSGGQRPLSGI